MFDIKGLRRGEEGSNQDLFVDETLENPAQTAESLAVEKKKLFGYLRSFFATNGNDFKHEDLFDDFEFAFETGSDEDYTALLNRLSEAGIKFNEFSVTKPETEEGRHIVHFDSDENDDNSASETPMAEVDALQNHSLSEEVNELRREVALYKSMVHLDHSSLKTRLDEITKQQQDHNFTSLNKISDIRSSVYSLIFEFYKKSEIVEEQLTMELPEDAYSFIMYKPWGLAGFTAWMVFTVQVVSYILAVIEEFSVQSTDGFARSPSLNLPLGATRLVHAGQAIAIFLIFLVNDGLWNSSVQLLNGYNDDLKNADIKFFWWLVSNVLRFAEGLAATAVIFVLIMLSDNIVTLFKDFTAMTFISSLDDVVFQLAKMAVLGRSLKHATECGEDIVVTRTDLINSGKSRSRISVKSCQYKIRTPLFVIFVIMVSIYSLWLYIGFIPQMTGAYLCQKMYVELDDVANPKLAFFSGNYNIIRNIKPFGFIDYVEERAANADEGMRIKLENNKWVFLRKYHNSKSPCVWAESENVKDEEQFNLFKVDASSWFATQRPVCPQDDEGEDDLSDSALPIKLIFECLDQYPIQSIFQNSDADVCEEIEIDERPQFGEFVNAKTWERQFSILKSEKNLMEVYNHPVYFKTRDNEHQYVIYAGTRWGMFALGRNEYPSVTSLFEQEHFHLVNANINFTFFSETVNFQSPGYTFSPVGLKWYLASNPTIEGYQRVEMNSVVTANFICSACGNDNPCFFDGVCTNTKICQCKTGSYGKLCQVPPTGNGNCDTFFNKIEFNFDGGDCCLETCVSTPKHQCGRDPTGRLYIGYDYCHKKDFSYNGLFWRTMTPSMTGIGKISKVSLNPNGQTMAVISSDSHSVNIYDVDAKHWNVRGPSVTMVENIKKSTIELSSYPFVTNRNSNRQSPVTLAVLTRGSVSVFDWQDNVWNENQNDLFNNATVEITQVELRNHGLILGVLYANGTLNMFQREDLTSQWFKMRDHYLSRHSFFSMSSSGEAYVLANSESIEFFMEYGNHHELYTGLGLPIRKIKMNYEGTTVAVLQGKPRLKSQITIFDILDQRMVQRETSIRGIPYADTKMQITHHGRYIFVLLDQSGYDISSNEKFLLGYEWDSDMKTWELVERMDNTIDSIMSEDESVFVLLPDPRNDLSDSLVEVYHFHLSCKKSGIFHLTVNLSVDNTGLSWEIIEVFSKKNWRILEQGGPYPPGSTSIVKDICIPEGVQKNKSAIVIRVTDYDLDGLTPPGSIGISINGTIPVDINKTIGYQNVIHLLGNNESSLHFVESLPWEKYSFHTHEKCASKSCKWEQVGLFDHTNGFGGSLIGAGLLEVSTPHSISSDGLIIALSRRDSVTDTTQKISMFKFIDDIQGWKQIGSDIFASDASDYFGWSKSLSACGYILAVGDPSSSVNGSNSGQVYVYALDEDHDTWNQLGSTINGTENLKMGFSLSLSADGSVLAIGSSNLRDNAEDTCNVYVYSYSKSIKDWIMRGECLNTLDPEHNKDSKGTYLSLSSNGRFLVVGVPYSSPSNDMNYAGHVSSYQYLISSNSWIQLGETLRGYNTYDLLGNSVSISSDGSIIAMSGIASASVKAFQYSPRSKSWKQLGRDIQGTGPSGVAKVALSSNGGVLVVSFVDHFSVYLYDRFIDDWLIQNHSSEKFQNVFFLSIAVSADAVTVAAMNKTSMDVSEIASSTMIYRLTKSRPPKDCRSDEFFFSITVKPDSFPKDITWEIYNQFQNLAIFSISDTDDQGIYFYQQCISNNTTAYTFAIHDSFGDGICCDWGQGSFQVELNRQVILNDDGFKSHSYVCMSSSYMAILRIHFEKTKIEDNELKWSLMSSTNKKIASDITSYNPYMYGLCVRENDCFTFAAKSSKGQGYYFNISIDDELLYHVQTDYFISKKKIGRCDSKIIKSCPEGQKLFSFDIFTDTYPEETSWDFNTMNLTKIPQDQKDQIIEYESCVSVSQDECASFVLLDHWGDGGPTYNVTYDGRSHVGKMESAIAKIDFSGNCSKICDEGQGLFEIDFAQRESEQFSWEILDDQYNKLVKDRIYVGLKHFYDSVCLPLDKCMTFVRLDSPNRKADIYRIRWNNTMEMLIDGNVFNEEKDTFEFGLCES